MCITAVQDKRAAAQLPASVVVAFLVGATLALAGGFWDDAWHTERGRDSFWIAPHLAIYGGITLAGGALAAWTLLAVRERGVRAVLRPGPLALALLSVCVTLASAPVDNLWHVAFGRDAVIWSPPHVLGIVGTAGLSVSMLVELQRTQAAWAPLLRWVAGALLIAAMSFLVVEYDTDVPQFDELWYLPVLALGTSFALGLIRLATGEVFAATRAAAVHLGFFALVGAFLAVEGFDTPKLPLILGSALALDLAAQRGLGVGLQALVYAAALYVLYVPALDLVGQGVRLDAADVALGLPLAFGAATLVLWLIFRQPGRVPRVVRRIATAVLTIVVTLSVAVPAVAHDPGQGEPAGSFDYRATLSGQRLEVAAHRNGTDCGRLVPLELVGRRAGEVERGALERSVCEFRGSIAVPAEGRWFVYLDVRRSGETVESWIPVKVDEGERSFTEQGRFAYVADREPATALKWVAGTVMYGLVIAFLVAIVALARRAAPVAA